MGGFLEEGGDNYALLIGEALDALKNAGLGHVKISIACSAVPDVLAKSKISALIEKGLYGINVMTYDFFGTRGQIDYHIILICILHQIM